MLTRLVLFCILNLSLLICTYIAYILILARPAMNSLKSEEYIKTTLKKNKPFFCEELLSHIGRHRCFAHHTTPITDHYTYIYTILQQLGGVIDATLHILPPQTRRPLMQYVDGRLCILVLSAPEENFIIIEGNRVHKQSDAAADPIFSGDNVTAVNNGTQNALLLTLHIDKDSMRENSKLYDSFVPHFISLKNWLT